MSAEKKQIGISILGGTGYGAGELLRLLSAHPHAAVENIVSQSMAGGAVASAHSHLAALYPSSFDEAFSFEKLKKYSNKVVFSALPHGSGAQVLADLQTQHGKDLLIIDLSGDFRLKDEKSHTEHYPETAFQKPLRDNFVYGLSELFREQIVQAKCIANPGCLSSACILAGAPLASLGLKQNTTICFDAKTGTSGAGKAAKDAFHHPSRHSNFEAYKVLAHRHEPEISETLGVVFGKRPQTMFVPHLLPVSRGIFVTAYAELERSISQQEAERQIEKFYQGSFFIRLRKTTPTLNDVVGSNFCDLSVQIRGTQIVIMAAIDNLVKGMAGQAIQNMNLMCGLNETTGLRVPPLSLV